PTSALDAEKSPMPRSALPLNLTASTVPENDTVFTRPRPEYAPLSPRSWYTARPPNGRPEATRLDAERGPTTRRLASPTGIGSATTRRLRPRPRGADPAERPWGWGGGLRVKPWTTRGIGAA